MMQLIIKDGLVIATHEDYQDVADLYPDTECVSWDELPMQGPFDDFPYDPRTEEQKKEAYKDARRVSYPPVADQLDMIYRDQLEGTTTWVDTITAVKEQFPKPSIRAIK